MTAGRNAQPQAQLVAAARGRDTTDKTGASMVLLSDRRRKDVLGMYYCTMQWNGKSLEPTMSRTMSRCHISNYGEGFSFSVSFLLRVFFFFFILLRRFNLV